MTLTVILDDPLDDFTFRYKTTSNYNDYDTVIFYIDDVYQLYTSGHDSDGSWKQFGPYSLGVGTHTLRWKYFKSNGLSDDPLDELYIDQV